MNINITQEEAIIKKAKAIINKTMHKYNLDYNESYKYLFEQRVYACEYPYRDNLYSRISNFQNEFDKKNKLIRRNKHSELWNKWYSVRNEYEQKFKIKNPELKDRYDLFYKAFDNLDFIKELSNEMETEKKKDEEYNQKAKLEWEFKEELFVIENLKKYYEIYTKDENKQQREIFFLDFITRKYSFWIVYKNSEWGATKKKWGIIYRQFESNLNEVNMWLNVKKSYNIRDTLQRENRERSKKYVELNKNYLPYLSGGKEDANEYQKAKLIALDLWEIDSLNQLNDLLIDEILSPERKRTEKSI